MANDPINSAGAGAVAQDQPVQLPTTLEDAANSANENEDTSIAQPQEQGSIMARPGGGSSTSGQISGLSQGNVPQQPPIQVVAAHPKASLFHGLLNALGGGDKTQYSVDPQTGSMSVTRVPQTAGQLSKSIIAGALTGLFAGAGERGPGSEGRSAAAGFQAVQQQRQMQQAQAQQNATQDYERQEQTKVRKAQILKANYDAMKSAYALGKEDDEQKDKIVSNHADDLAQWENTGAIKDKNIPSDQLLKKGYDPSKYIAVPDGKVSAFKPDGSRATDSNGVPLSQLTYSVIDGTTQVPLNQDKYNKMIQYGLQKPGASKNIPEGATISSAVLAQMNHRMDLIDQTQHEIDTAIGPGKVNIIDKIKENPGYLQAIEAFHNDGSSTEVDNQINNLQAQNPKAAGLMRSLVGKDNLESLKEKREARAKAEATKQETEQRLAAEHATPEGQQKLKNEQLTQIEKQLQIQKLQKEGGIDLSKINTTAEGLEGTNFNPQDPNYRVNQGIIQQIQAQDPGLAASVRAIGEGREIMTPQAQRTKDGQSVMKAVNLAYPDYNAAKVESYHKGRQVGTSGTLGNKVNSFATAMDHLQRYYDNINNISATAGVGSIAAVLGNESAKALQTDRTALASEIASAYKGGVPSKEEIDKWEKSLSGGTAMAAKNGAVETAKLLHGKFSEYSNQYRNMIPGGLKDDNFQLMSNTAANAYEHVTGQKIGNTQPFTQGQNTPQTQPIYAKNPQTNARVVSNDGGKTWQPAP
jgi:hypothetical protein